MQNVWDFVEHDTMTEGDAQDLLRLDMQAAALRFIGSHGKAVGSQLAAVTAQRALIVRRYAVEG